MAHCKGQPMSEESIFMEALQKQTLEERAAFLDQACADAELRRSVELLLKAHDKAGHFLQRVPQNDPAIDQHDRERPGTVIGPYKLLQKIGEGGMGTVFMAEQTQPVQRKVALKVIKAGMDSRQVIARFEAERQALAMMDHVNIARVFDGGTTESGRPYFVMELVNGVPITKYCDDNCLTPRERLELFVPVCQAIQHAHQKGIIHRDIKPSNVMITLYDGKPVPKVIDFGVAKATEQKLTERTLFTQYGTMVGTLAYISPDQAVQACPPSAGYLFRKFARRNKRVLATAALFGVMLLAAVGAVTATVGWAVRDRESREQDLARKAERDLALTEQGVRQALEQVARIRGELHAVLTKPGGVQELLNQPGRWNFLIQSAQSELAQARRSTARADGSLSAELTQALHKLEEQLTGDEADRLLALRLEKIRLDQAKRVEGSFDFRKAAAEYPQAFAGFAVLKEDAAAVAARLRSSPIN